jgi:molybdate transport system substrate-binding protein
MLKILKFAGLIAVFFFCGESFSQITVATAANVQFAMEDLRAEFTKETGTEVKAVYGASGKLVTQIKNGAPFDIFLSADVGYADSAVKWGYSVSEPKIYAFGLLALWTMKNIDLKKGMSVLSDPAVGKIAIGDPKVTVYGPAAIEVMKKAGVYEAVASKLVFGDNITQVAQYIVTGAADIGFSALSIAMSRPMQGKGTWVLVDKTSYSPLGQAAIILRYGDDNNPETSRAFYNFIYSVKAREIFKQYGYELPQ